METGRSENIKDNSSRHLGHLIKRLINESGLEEKYIATYIGVSEDKLKKIYDSPSIDTEKLIKSSELLKHNIYDGFTTQGYILKQKKYQDEN